MAVPHRRQPGAQQGAAPQDHRLGPLRPRRPRQTPGAGPPDAVVANDWLRRRLRPGAGLPLPPRQLEALVLRRSHDLSQRDIAAAMGTSEGRGPDPCWSGRWTR
ncbi:MAG: sigma-70 family RNA polymerase sigma factor [bacterium]|nr:sigma-70 family RNA polymerase sigma factor [bacterium]